MTDALEPDASAIDRTLPDARPARTGAVTVAAPTPPGPAQPGDEKVMSLVDHLAELRRRVAISVAAVLIGGVIGFWFAPQIITILLEPLPDSEGAKVQFLTLSGPFLLYLRISLVVGILLGLPVILYQLWAFVAPGLTPRERRATLPWIPATIVFFLMGTAVAYVTLPYAVSFLSSFQIPGQTVLFPSGEAYFGFVTMIFLIFGAVMQFPIVLVVLAKLGILTVDRLKQSRRMVLLGIVVFAVVATPGGDPISPLVMSAVMYLLYEVTIVILTRQARGQPEAVVADVGSDDDDE